MWLYAIRPAYVPAVQKIGPTPIIEQAISFKFPERINSDPEADAVARISGEHRELSLREISRKISSVGPAAKAKEIPQFEATENAGR